uniref:Lines homolog 1 n=1 Tax=Leptobrachium leishanense TaxID=445787 RepID=A0A8C5M7Y4_9ANUR
MEDMFSFLKKLNEIFLHGDLLHDDIQKCASLLVPQILDVHLETPVYRRGGSPWCPRDVALLQLSLIQKLVLKAENSDTELGVKHQYTRLVEVLDQTGVTTTIIKLCDTPDKVLSHLSSKCLSCLVLFELKCQNKVNIYWLSFCLKNLQKYPECHALLQCLMSLISVFKGILKDETFLQAGNLSKLLEPLHPLLITFCTSVFSAAENQPVSPEFVSIVSCLLDLLEHLAALRILFKLPFPLCQQVLSVSLPRALAMLSSSLPYCVKKQVILVLKKCLLRKPGDDFLLSAHISSGMPEPSSEEDMATLAEALLNAVSEGWLFQVPVSEKPSNFGGANDALESNPDLVILGAVSLSVLKALEVKLHTTVINSTLTATLQTLMDHLLDFLKHHLGWRKLAHPCEWVSLTFLEQDDDLLEVAKCLLKMYTQCHSYFSPVPECLEDGLGVWNSPLHHIGCNPHCIFVLLLKNVAFDDSVLLDFLISSETCFLEYFVRSGVENHSRPADIEAALSGANALHSALSHPVDCDYSSSLDALQRLVAYDSSDDSGTESAEKEQSYVTRRTHAASNDLDNQTGRLESMLLDQEYSNAAIIADNVRLMMRTQQKLARCLRELQEAICRLWRKKLFPYNPSALLKLLTQVNDLNEGTC